MASQQTQDDAMDPQDALDQQQYDDEDEEPMGPLLVNKLIVRPPSSLPLRARPTLG